MFFTLLNDLPSFSFWLWMLFLLFLNDTELSITLHICLFDQSRVIHSLLTKLAHQFVFGDQFLTHVPAQQLAILDQQQWDWLDQAAKPFKLEAEPVKSVVPKDNGSDQHKPVGKGCVIIGHRILGRICDQSKQ